MFHCPALCTLCYKCTQYQLYRPSRTRRKIRGSPYRLDYRWSPCIFRRSRVNNHASRDTKSTPRCICRLLVWYIQRHTNPENLVYTHNTVSRTHGPQTRCIFPPDSPCTVHCRLCLCTSPQRRPRMCHCPVRCTPCYKCMQYHLLRYSTKMRGSLCRPDCR